MLIALLIVLLTLGLGLTDILAFGPLGLLGLLHIPAWLGLAVFGSIIAWLLGGD